MAELYEISQNKIQQRYLSLLSRYTARDFPYRSEDTELEDELGFTEELMLAQPPRCMYPDGVMRPRAKGLIKEPILITKGLIPPPTFITFTEAGIKIIPESDWAGLISEKNRTPPSDYCLFTLDQDGVGSCAAEGSVGSLMERRSADGQGHVLLNPWAVYHTTSGGTDGGSNPLDNLSFLQKYGCPSEAVWPRSKGWRARPSEQAVQDGLQYRISQDGLVRLNNWTELGTMLLLGFPVAFGYSGHWIFATDLLSITRLKYKNSWGKDWGDNGFGSLSKSSVYWAYGVWAIIAVIDRRAA